MARKVYTASTVLPVYVKEVPVDKSEKEKGLRYTLLEPIVTRIAVLTPDKVSLVECNDGWFWVYAGRERLWFRLAPWLIESNKNILTEVKI